MFYNQKCIYNYFNSFSTTYETLFNEISNKDSTVSCDYRDEISKWFENCKGNLQNYTYEEIHNKENEISEKIEELRVYLILLFCL